MHESESHGAIAQVLEHLRELGPEFLLAWAGWLVHSFVHVAGHAVRTGLRVAGRAAVRVAKQSMHIVKGVVR